MRRPTRSDRAPKNGMITTISAAPAICTMKASRMGSFSVTVA